MYVVDTMSHKVKGFYSTNKLPIMSAAQPK